MKYEYIKRKKVGRKPRMPNKEEFIMLYQNPLTTAEELAKHYGVTKGTIYNWAWKIKEENRQCINNIATED